MRGRTKLVSAVGKERDSHMVRIDFNTAKKFDNIRYGRYFLFYVSLEQWLYLDYNDIVWAYRRLEDVDGRLGKKRPVLESPEDTGSDRMHTLMLVAQNGQRVGIHIEEEENIMTAFEFLKSKNKFIDIGYNKEKEERYITNV